MIDSVYWIWFQLVFGIGTRRAELFMNYFEHPKQIFDGITDGKMVPGMLEPQELSACEPAMERAKNIQHRTLNKGAVIVTPDHPDYPQLLLPIYSKPAALYVKGNLSCLNQGVNIAMVGTRKFTGYGQQVACQLAQGLASSGVTVVSGLAKGIDTICHTAALEAGGCSVGVLGCGLDVDYPAGSGPLKTRMTHAGAVVTEFPLGLEVRPGNFPVRNRIISGMCHGTVVVEAALKSGSVITAEHAMEQGRDVFAVPSSIFLSNGSGTNALIKEGAKLVEQVSDILEEYQIAQGRSSSSQPPYDIAETAVLQKKIVEPAPCIPQEQPAPTSLSETGRQVYALLKPGPATVDELSVKGGIQIAALHTALTELEIYRLVTLQPGRKFMRTDGLAQQ